MASDVDTISEPPPVCMFWKLPMELRDMIYGMAYGEPREFKVKSRTAWNGEQEYEMKHNRDSYMPKTFPESPVGHLCANKQYFQESLRVWMRCTVFKLPSGLDYEKVWEKSTAVGRYILKRISSMTLSEKYSCFSCANGVLPNLLHLTISIDFTRYETKEKLAWMDEYSDVELATIDSIKYLLRFRGLRSFDLKRTPCWKAKKPEEEKRWIELQNQTENLVRDVITRPYEPGSGPGVPISFEEALKLTKEKKKRKASKATRAQQSSRLPTSLSDNEVPESPDALLRLFLTRPEAMSDWIKDLKTRAAAQGSMSIQQRDETALSKVLPEPHFRKSSRVRAAKSKTDARHNVPSSRMGSSPDWHFTKHVDSDTLEEVVRCTEHVKPKKRRAR